MLTVYAILCLSNRRLDGGNDMKKYRSPYITVTHFDVRDILTISDIANVGTVLSFKDGAVMGFEDE